MIMSITYLTILWNSLYTCTRFLDFRNQYSPLYITFQYILMKEENKIIMIESNEMKI